MGIVYEVSCTACDYRATVYEGAGMESVCVAAVCPDCRELREASRPAPLQAPPPGLEVAVDDRCEECGTKLAPWRASEELAEPSFGHLTAGETLATGPCPRCGSAVEARETGLWD